MGDETQREIECDRRRQQAGFVALQLGGGQQAHPLPGDTGPAQGGANRGLDVGGSGTAPAADADDVVAQGLAGGGDHWLSGDGVGHLQRQGIGAAFVAGEQRDGPAAQGVAADHGGIVILRLHERRETARHHTAGRQHHQA